MNARGFSLVEVLMSLGVLAFVTLSIATGVGTGHSTTKALEEEVALVSRGQEYLERLLAVPFGRSSDPVATAPELTEMFDDDANFGSMTLHKLRRFGPVEFEAAAFPVRGVWRVVVDQDLNGDGDLSDPDEGRADLMRIEISHRGRVVARTERFDTTR